MIQGILLQLKDKFSAQGEVVEVLCSILRAGFSETEPGPFVFPPEMVTAFITSTWHNRIPVVVNTASAFISSLHYGKYKSYVSQALAQLLPWVLGLLGQLPNPDDDSELTQSCIEFIQRAMIRRPDIFMSQPSHSLEFIFALAIKLLDGNEPLPKAAAAEFWVSGPQSGKHKCKCPHNSNILYSPISFLDLYISLHRRLSPSLTHI